MSIRNSAKVDPGNHRRMLPMGDHNRSPPGSAQFAWAIRLAIGMLILPKTPRFLITRGHNAQAARSLSRLRRLDVDDPVLAEELYAKEQRAWKSKDFAPTVSFMDAQGLDGRDARKSTLADLESAAGRRTSDSARTFGACDQREKLASSISWLRIPATALLGLRQCETRGRVASGSRETCPCDGILTTACKMVQRAR